MSPFVFSLTRRQALAGPVLLAGILTSTLALPLGAAPPQAESVKSWENFDFRSRVVKVDDLKPLNEVQLKYLRGIVFGKHGRVFDERAIQAWLKTRNWYHIRPQYKLADLNDTERANMDAIKEAEHRKHDTIEPGDLKFYRKERVTAKNLGEHSRIEWIIMGAEIEAIHGKRFPETPWLQSFFEQRYWYHANPRYAPSILSDIERANMRTIAEAQKKGRGIALAPGDMEQFQDSRIDASLLSGLSLFELRLLRNEVYARRGKRFHTAWIQEHFGAEPWYSPGSGFAEPALNANESANVALIVRQEQTLHDELARKPLTTAEIDGLFLEDARKLRNEIYARHGKVFRDKWLNSYFRSLNWYRPNAAYVDNMLTSVERSNVQTLLKYERGAQTAANSVAA